MKRMLWAAAFSAAIVMTGCNRGEEKAGAPVDAYGVGSSLLRGHNDFTADIVRVDGRPVAKVGRQENPNPRLKRVA